MPGLKLICVSKRGHWNNWCLKRLKNNFRPVYLFPFQPRGADVTNFDCAGVLVPRDIGVQPSPKGPVSLYTSCSGIPSDLAKYQFPRFRTT